MYKIGLKLWSINTDYYYDEAKRLYDEGVFDYIELYVVPDSLDRIAKWKNIGIPISLHAPHFAHNVNLADAEKLDYNKAIYEEVEIYRQSLNAMFTVVHGGMNGSITETIRQLNIIKPKNFLIENKPYKVPLPDGNFRYCRGFSIEEIARIITETNCGFCLDIGHAICSANSQKIPPYEYLKNFYDLKPLSCHLSDNFIDSELDGHLNIGKGTYDMNRILKIIYNVKYLALETKKNSKFDLNDFKEDVKYIKFK